MIATPTYVTVTVIINHRTTLLQATGITSLPIKGSATARPLPGLKIAGTTTSDQGGS